MCKNPSIAFQDTSLVFIYVLSEPSLFIRAAKDLLSRIQKKFQKPQEKLKALREAISLLSNHSEELRAAEELLREAGSKTQESNLLLLLVKANLKDFRVSLSVSFSIRSATTRVCL